MGSSSLTAFLSHAAVAIHQLLGELPSVDQTKCISVDLSIPPSGRGSAASVLAGCLWSKQADDARFSHSGGLSESQARKTLYANPLHVYLTALDWAKGNLWPSCHCGHQQRCKRSSKSSNEPLRKGRLLRHADSAAPDMLISRRVF